jgi:hypothetical protein
MRSLRAHFEPVGSHPPFAFNCGAAALFNAEPAGDGYGKTPQT